MKRVWGHILGAAPVFGSAVVLFSACVHDDSTLFVRSEQAQPTSSTGGVCTYTADPTQPVVNSGVLDYQLRRQYDAEFLLANQMVPMGNPSQLMTETSNINIQGAVVRITKANGTQVATYTRLAAATIPPSTGTTPGFGLVALTILDPNTLAADAEVQAALAFVDDQTNAYGSSGFVRFITYTKFFGATLGGKSVESNEFEFPVDVCAGCLVGYTNITSTNRPTPNCVALGAASSATAPCLLGQDYTVPCSVVCGGIEKCTTNTNQ